MRKTLIVPVVWFSCACVVFILSLGASGASKASVPLWERIASDDHTTVGQAVEEYREMRERTVAALVKMLSDYAREEKDSGQKPTDQNKVTVISTAILLLGEMHADSAAPVLAKYLSFNNRTGFNLPVMFHPPGKEDMEEIGIRRLYPAVDSLITMGQASIEPCVEAFAGFTKEYLRMKDDGRDRMLVYPDYKIIIGSHARLVISCVEARTGAVPVLKRLMAHTQDAEVRSIARGMLEELVEKEKNTAALDYK